MLHFSLASFFLYPFLHHLCSTSKPVSRLLPLTLPQTRFLPHKPLKKKLRRCQNRRSFSSRFFQIVIVALHLRRCCGGSPCRCLNLCRRSRGPPIDHQAVAGSYRLQTRHEYGGSDERQPEQPHGDGRAFTMTLYLTHGNGEESIPLELPASSSQVEEIDIRLDDICSGEGNFRI